MSQTPGGRPKVIGTTKRLRQFEADHHSDGDTAWSTARPAKLLEPGAHWPVLRHAFSAVVRSLVVALDARSQLIPEIGTTTMEQAVLSLQPRDSFSMSERTSNWTDPSPASSV